MIESPENYSINGIGMNILSTSDEFVKEAIRIVESAKREGVILRVIGACAIRIHCPHSRDLLDNLNRNISDIDFMSYTKFEDKLDHFFKKQGYQPALASTLYIHMYGQLRRIYTDSKNQKIDVFFDRLEMCHTIDLTNRLEVDYPTISLSDILLEKMQIVKLNEKDVYDALIIILEHNIREEERECINSKYISRILANDWGLYYTITTNLRKLKNLLPQYRVFDDNSKTIIDQKINKLLDTIEKQPKSLKWKMRARIGTSKKWYRDVDEISMGNKI